MRQTDLTIACNWKKKSMRRKISTSFHYLLTLFPVPGNPSNTEDKMHYSLHHYPFMRRWIKAGEAGLLSSSFSLSRLKPWIRPLDTHIDHYYHFWWCYSSLFSDDSLSFLDLFCLYRVQTWECFSHRFPLILMKPNIHLIPWLLPFWYFVSTCITKMYYVL